MSTIILICGAALIIYAIYGNVQRLRGKSKSSCCGGPEAVTVKKVAIQISLTIRLKSLSLT
jgi:hypothetical protein